MIKTDLDLFWEHINAPTALITGTNGKSTVADALAYIGKNIGFNVNLCGNIGIPALDTLDQDTSFDLHIIECSSYQLAYSTPPSSTTAVCLNIEHDHLAWHRSHEHYIASKKSIYHHTKKPVFNADCNHFSPHDVLLGCSWTLNRPKDNQFGLVQYQGIDYLAFGKTTLCPCSDLSIQGSHQYANMLAVLSLSHQLNWPISKVLPALKTYRGLDHRFQKISTQDGRHWINDSKSTNIASLKAALRSCSGFLDHVVLLVGGKEKSDEAWESIITSLKTLKAVIFFGESSQNLYQFFSPHCEHARIEPELKKAVALAGNITQKGDTILLSPGCASFDAFKSFESRGQSFEQWVISL